MSGLVDYQKKLFTHMEELNALGEEDQFVRFSSINQNFVIKSSAIAGIVIMPKIIPVPGEKKGVAGLIHAQGQVWTVFDFASLMDDKKRTNRSSGTKIILLNSSLMDGVAIMVDRTYSMLSVNEFHEITEIDKTLPDWAQKAFRYSSDPDMIWNVIDTEGFVADEKFTSDH